jgi:NAD kinase
MSCGSGHLGFLIGIKNSNFAKNLPMIIDGQFGFNCPSGFREEAF